ncbi:MAG: Flagellar biosynthetic protein FlhB [Gammaproteobacteria bacterium]|nr:Flagellar biosynthetic protein FlhB [Gammaproteobacteria bacterium]
MAEREGQERTEQATDKRLRDARSRGEIARSREFTTMMLLMGTGAIMLLAGGRMGSGLTGTMKEMFTLSTREALSTMSLPEVFMGALGDALMSVLPLIAAAFAIALLAPVAIGGWAWSSEALGMKWERLDPLRGFGRMFSANSLVELGKALLKLVLFTAVLLALLWNWAAQIVGLEHADARAGLLESLHLVSRSFLVLASVTIVIAMVDVPWQLYSHARRLRMTRQEVREEHKETEGSPEVKGKIRRMQLEVAARRMMEEVPKADVIVTNPTHYAVALRYDAKMNVAPLVVAKGADEVAQQIIRIGAHHRVTTFSAPPLARAIFHSTKVGSEIPAGLYVAVARVLAYVFQLRAIPGGREVRPPADLPIPDELRRD